MDQSRAFDKIGNALLRGDVECAVNLFESEGFSANHFSPLSGRTLLSFAADSDCPLFIDFLISRGAAVDMRFDHRLNVNPSVTAGCTALMFAGTFDTAQKLIASGADPLACDGNGVWVAFWLSRKMSPGAALAVLKNAVERGLTEEVASQLPGLLLRCEDVIARLGAVNKDIDTWKRLRSEIQSLK